MLIGGLDVGTTGCKLTVYDTAGDLIGSSYREYNVSRSGGEHEIDADAVWDAVCSVITDVCSGKDVSAIGVTTFGETFAALDADGNILLPSMLYTDPRGADETLALCAAAGEGRLTYISGVKPNCMYSLPKIMWIKNNMPDVYKKIKYIMLMQDLIVYRLTGRRQIDYSLAARTMAFDIRKKTWSREIFEYAGVDVSLMSEPVPTGTEAGQILPSLADRLKVNREVTVVSCAHDQVASAVGAGAFAPGDAVDGTGTVECVTPVFDRIPDNEAMYNEGYSVVPYVFDGTYVCYALSFTGGAVLKWYRDNFARGENKDNIFAALDKACPKAPTGILVMPHFAGAANPYMDSCSKAAFIGLTLEHTNNDIYKALMEGVTYEMMVNIEHLESYGITPDKLYATGGGASSEVWLQIKADILRRPITALNAKEVGACGTCMLSAVAVGAFDSLSEASLKFVRYGKTFTPQSADTEAYKKLYGAYKNIYPAICDINKML